MFLRRLLSSRGERWRHHIIFPLAYRDLKFDLSKYIEYRNARAVVAVRALLPAGRVSRWSSRLSSVSRESIPKMCKGEAISWHFASSAAFPQFVMHKSARGSRKTSWYWEYIFRTSKIANFAKWRPINSSSFPSFFRVSLFTGGAARHVQPKNVRTTKLLSEYGEKERKREVKTLIICFIIFVLFLYAVAYCFCTIYFDYIKIEK